MGGTSHSTACSQRHSRSRVFSLGFDLLAINSRRITPRAVTGLRPNALCWTAPKVSNVSESLMNTLLNILDIALIAASACVSGWFLKKLLPLKPEGHRWPVVQKCLFTAAGSGALLLALLCLSWAYNYHHLPPWQVFIVSPCIAAAGATIQVYQGDQRRRFHIPASRKRHS